MIKTKLTDFSNSDGSISKMYLSVRSIDIPFNSTEKVIIQFEYYTKMEIVSFDGGIIAKKVSRERDRITMTPQEADGMIAAVSSKHNIDMTQGYHQSLKTLLPYILLEYQLTNIDNNKTPFAIPVDDWELA